MSEKNIKTLIEIFSLYAKEIGCEIISIGVSDDTHQKLMYEMYKQQRICMADWLHNERPGVMIHEIQVNPVQRRR